MKPTDLDVPLGPERRRALHRLGDRWSLWILLAIHERDGARFTDLAVEPGLSRRVLADRLRQLVDDSLVETRQYQARPPRSRYLLTPRGQQVRRHALAMVHVASGGSLDEVAADAPRAESAIAPASMHPADALLLQDLDAAMRIHTQTVEPIARYDRQYRTSLLDTLQTWLACDASVSVAAARLHAHRHTVRYRLGRVQELTSLDTGASADREQLALGLRARRILIESGRLDP